MTEGRLRIYQAASKIRNILGKNRAISEDRRLSRQEVFDASGLDEELFHAACMHLQELGHVMAPLSSQEMWLTAEGRNSYYRERAGSTLQANLDILENLRATRPSFPLNNVLNIYGNVSNAQIQQGTSHSSQSGSFSPTLVEELSLFLEQLRGSLGNLPLSIDDEAEANAVIEGIEAQLRSTAPNPGLVKRSLGILQRIFEGTTSNVMGSWVAWEIAKFMSSMETL